MVFFATSYFLCNSLRAWYAGKMFTSGSAAPLMESVCGKLKLSLSFLLSRS